MLPLGNCLFPISAAAFRPAISTTEENRLSLPREHFSHQRGEAGLGVEALEFRVNGDKRQEQGSVLVRFLQRCERLLFLSQAHVDGSQVVGRHVVFLSPLQEFLQDYGKDWSGREDLNLRPPGPEPGALPG